MKISLLIFVAIVCLYSEASFSSGDCTAEKLARAQKKVSKVIKESSGDSWGKLRAAFKTDRECLSIHESYDFGEAVRFVMQKHWDQVVDVEKYKDTDIIFYQFILSGLSDETTNITDVNQIRNLAETKCPSKAIKFCAEVLAQVKKHK